MVPTAPATAHDHGAAAPAATVWDALRVPHCYQCGKCTAGCPVAAAMDVMPNQLVRLVQLGQVKRAMATAAIWNCVSCLTCSERCPQTVDCAGVMDTLRQLAAAHDTVPASRREVLAFYRAFLADVRRHGRLSEMELVARFKIAGFLANRSVPFLLKDALLGPKMMQRQKLHVLPRPVRDRAVVERIFARCLADEPAAAPAAATTEGHH